MDKIRYLCGTFALLVALTLWGTHVAMATSYTEYWRASYYRTVTGTRYGQVSGALCLGPAQWVITGTIGTSTFSEIWQVGDGTSLNGNDWITSGNPFNLNTTVSYGFRSVCVDDESNNTDQLDMNPTGLYGGFLTVNNGWLDSWDLRGDFLGVRSMPKKWTITGSISE